MPRVSPGNAVRVTSDAYPGRRFSGRVARVLHALDPRTRTMGIEVDIPNPENLLKPGMYARVELVVEVRPGALLLPLEVLTGTQGAPTVLVVRDGKVAATVVELGPTDGPLVQVVKGLGPDSQIILQGKELVRDGMAVSAVPAKVY